MAKRVNSFSELFSAGPSKNPISEGLAEILPPLEDVPYMDGKPLMSIFHIFLRFVIWSFLEEVMAILVSKGQSAANLET